MTIALHSVSGLVSSRDNSFPVETHGSPCNCERIVKPSPNKPRIHPDQADLTTYHRVHRNRAQLHPCVSTGAGIPTYPYPDNVNSCEGRLSTSTSGQGLFAIGSQLHTILGFIRPRRPSFTLAKEGQGRDNRRGWDDLLSRPARQILPRQSNAHDGVDRPLRSGRAQHLSPRFLQTSPRRTERY